MTKRVFDVLVSLLGLVCLGPLMIVIAVAIRITSPGPVLYRGQRVGRDGLMIEMLKFRSMMVDADKSGVSSTGNDDPRITSIGKILRALKLDELPQLINVLRGDMSFVGPRPQVQWAVDLYTPEEQQLLTIRPGITDYASIVFRNEGEILAGSKDPDTDYLRLIAPRKIELGLHYVQNHDLLIDIKIIIATALAVFGIEPTWCLPEWARQSNMSVESIKVKPTSLNKGA